MQLTQCSQLRLHCSLVRHAIRPIDTVIILLKWCTTSHARTAQCVRRPNRSTALYTCERTKSQTTGWKISARLPLPDGRPRIWSGQCVCHRKRDHKTYARCYRDMEYYLHMCQSMQNTISRLQSSTRLLGATKARASPNQWNSFNVDSEGLSRQPSPPHLSPMFCLNDLNPTSRIYINFRSTLIFSQTTHPYMFELQTLDSTTTSPPFMFLLFR